MLFTLVFTLSFTLIFGAEFTLLGKCPDIPLQRNFDSKRFLGQWYTVAVHASDNRVTYDCSTLQFNGDDQGLTLSEVYIDVEANRTKKGYFARIDPTYDSGDTAKFIVSYEDGDKVIQFPFSILYTDYNNYAIAYTCTTLKKRIMSKHYAFTWVLARSNEKLFGKELDKVQKLLFKYQDLKDNQNSIIYKDFNESSCSFNESYGAGFFTNNFW